MKQIITILFLVISVAAYAQEKPALTSKADSLQVKFNSAKSETLSLANKNTSLQQAASLKDEIQTKYDSIANLVNKPQEELNRYLLLRKRLACAFVRPEL